MSAVGATLDFLATGSNRSTQAISWGPNNLLAISSHHGVAFFDTESGQVLQYCTGHAEFVQCVQWFPSPSSLPSPSPSLDAQDKYEDVLLSGSVDGTVIVWARCSSISPRWIKAGTASCPLPDSECGPVSSIATCWTDTRPGHGCGLAAISYSSNAVAVWRIDFNTGPVLHQVVAASQRPIMSVTLVHLPLRPWPADPSQQGGGSVVLAAGGVDSVIHIFVAASPLHQFSAGCQLRGHQDWIRCLHFSFPLAQEEDSDKVEVLLASGSQDRMVRTWLITQSPSQSHSVSPLTPTPSPLALALQREGHAFVSEGGLAWRAQQHSLLQGHQDWVHSVQWHPPTLSPTLRQPLSLLSASMDRTVLLWEPLAGCTGVQGEEEEEEEGLWGPVSSLGEFGHSALGFFGALWGPQGASILAHSYTGSLHLWHRSQEQGAAIGDQFSWLPAPAPGGHFDSVVDCDWSSDGACLLTASLDHTVRAFACTRGSPARWGEVGRPQVHGHAMHCVRFVPQWAAMDVEEPGRQGHCFVSGSEEKVLRVFESPHIFQLQLAGKHGVRAMAGGAESARPSALGLSQKAVAYVPTTEAGDDGLCEEQLVEHTLWPETHKLYGHGHQISSIAVAHSAALVATACKAQSTAAAQVWLWDVNKWAAVAQLTSHSLTVTHIAFSPDDKYILTVSRDRHLSIFERSPSADPGVPCSYRLAEKREAHKRIVWAADWAPLSPNQAVYLFATGSRDKLVKLWSIAEQDGSHQLTAAATLPPFQSPVTALSWSPVVLDTTKFRGYLLAVGLESGGLQLWHVDLGTSVKASRLWEADASMSHSGAVNSLAWRPQPPLGKEEGSEPHLQIASCSSDHSVRLYSVLL